MQYTITSWVKSSIFVSFGNNSKWIVVDTPSIEISISYVPGLPKEIISSLLKYDFDNFSVSTVPSLYFNSNSTNSYLNSFKYEDTVLGLAFNSITFLHLKFLKLFSFLSRI